MSESVHEGLDMAAETAGAERYSMGKGDGGLLALSFLSSLCFFFGHWNFRGFYYGPGIGLTVTHWVLTVYVMLLGFRRHTLHKSAGGIFLLALSLLLSASYGIFANVTLRLLNLPVLFLLTGLTLSALAGHTSDPLSAQGLWEGLRRCGCGLFRWWAPPFRFFSGRGDKRRRGDIVISAFLALAAVGVAAALLSSADEVFSGMITGALDWASRIDGSIVPKIIGAFLLGMAMFSFGYGLFRKPLPMHRAAAPKGTPVMFGTVLGALILVYGVFAYVQMRYLFAGEVSVSMSGGYAAYARSGFFQLVLVAFLTLALILPSLIVCRESRCVRLLSAAAALLTAVIDFSAFFRMRLYIGAYGLSTLRVITLWGIGMIMLALCMALIKAAWPAVRICPFLAAALLATWVALNYANVDRMVSQDLVARFNAGINPTGSDDEDRIAASLASDGYWRPAYYTAFEQISDPDVRQAALDMLHARAGAADEDGRLLSRPPAYDWCFSCLLVPEGNTGQIMADGQ